MMDGINQNLKSITDYQKQLKNVMDSKLNDGDSEEIMKEEEFSTYLSQAIGKVDQEISNSSNNISKLITGDLDNMHTAMIDMNKSQLVLQTAVQVRNKCVEAYNDIKNMQF